MKDEIYEEPKNPPTESEGLIDVRIRRYYAQATCPYCERKPMQGLENKEARVCTRCGLEITGLESRSGHQCVEEVIARHRKKLQERT